MNNKILSIMAAYRLEDNIREKLEGREIKPSTDAWKKLKAKLDAGQPKRKSLAWYYIAASFVGILILASVFFGQKQEVPKVQVVNENIKNQNPEIRKGIVTKKVDLEKIVFEKTVSDKINKKGKENENGNLIKPVQQKESSVDKKLEKDKVIAKTTEYKEQVPEPEINVPNHEVKFFNQKIKEVVASVKRLQETNSEVTAEEVERLLNSARRDIQTQQILSSNKVDAAALLQDVEWELEKSFRDKVFDALGDSFIKIRTAFIERND